MLHGKYFEKWKDICLTADNVASKVLDCQEAKQELSAQDMREILRITGDDEYVVVTNDKRIYVRA